MPSTTKALVTVSKHPRVTPTYATYSVASPAPIAHDRPDASGQDRAKNHSHVLNLSRRDLHHLNVPSAIEGARVKLASLRECSFSHNPRFGTAGLQISLQLIGPSMTLSCLELLETGLTDKSCVAIVQALKQMPALARLKLGDNRITAVGAETIAEALAAHPSLTQLHLGGNPLLDEGVVALARVLPHTNISHLALREVGVANHGITALMMAIASGARIHELQLRGNPLLLGVPSITVAVKVFTTLTVLELQKCDLDDFALAQLFAGLMANRSLTSLHVEGNQIGPISSSMLEVLLKTPSSAITQLFIDRCCATDSGALLRVLACVVGSNLTTLTINFNRVDDAGAVYLARALDHRSSKLLSLEIANCMISPNGMAMIFDALTHNTTLKHLDATKNFSGALAGAACARMIQSNQTIAQLLVPDNEIPASSMQLIEDSVMLNVSLRKFVFGGQSEERPLANIVRQKTRRTILQRLEVTKAAATTAPPSTELEHAAVSPDLVDLAAYPPFIVTAPETPSRSAGTLQIPAWCVAASPLGSWSPGTTPSPTIRQFESPFSLPAVFDEMPLDRRDLVVSPVWRC